MKKLALISIATVIAFCTVSAQTKEGAIIYECKVNNHKRITDEQMRAYIPEFRTTKHQLLFSDSVSVFKAVVNEESPEPSGDGGGGMRIMRFGAGGETGELYKNFAEAKSIEQREMGEKQFIIADTIRKQKWRLWDETKTIAGHICHKATAKQMQIGGGGGMRMMTMGGNGGNLKTDTSIKRNMPTPPKEIELVAWYADDIISPVGPENNGGLPGAILFLDIDNGTTVYTTTEIKNTVNKKDIKEPKKGKKVTKEEFRKLQMEMMQNMQMPGGGGRTIRIGS